MKNRFLVLMLCIAMVVTYTIPAWAIDGDSSEQADDTAVTEVAEDAEEALPEDAAVPAEDSAEDVAMPEAAEEAEAEPAEDKADDAEVEAKYFNTDPDAQGEIPYDAVGTIVPLQLDSLIDAELDGHELKWFSFKPAASGTYEFYSRSDENTVGALYVDNGSLYKLKAWNDYNPNTISEGDNNFYVKADLKAGTTYYYAATMFGDQSGTVEVGIRRVIEFSKSDIKLSRTTYTYDGTYHRPTVTIAGLKQGVDYSVDYYYNKYPGRACAEIYVGDNDSYTTVYFYIVPKKSKITSLKALPAGFVLKGSTSGTGSSDYQIQYSKYSNMSHAKTVTVYGTTKKILGLTGSKKYYVRVRTISDDRTKVSAWSSKKTVTTMKALPKSKVSKVKIVKSGTVKVTVAKKSGIDGYQVRYSRYSDMYGAKTKSWKKGSTATKISKLNRIDPYYFQVRTYKTVNGVKVYSSWSGKKKSYASPNSVSFHADKTAYDDDYGEERVEPYKIYYNGKGKLVVKAYIVNNRMFRADKFDWIRLKVYDDYGRTIGNQKFTNVKLGISPYGHKSVTFTFNTGTKRVESIRGMELDWEWDYYYTYSY